jgi:hypothetical protein
MELDNLNTITNDISELETQLQNQTEITLDVVHPYQLTSVSSKQKSLITGVTASQKLNKKGLEFKFKNRLPVYKVDISFDPSSSNSFSIEYISEEGQAVEKNATMYKDEKGKAYIRVDAYIDTFKLKSTASLRTLLSASPAILKVEPLIYSMQALAEAVDIADEQENIQSQLQENLNSAKKYIEAEKANLAVQKSSLEKKIAATEVENTKKSHEIAAKETEVNKIVDEKNTEIETLNTTIRELDKKQAETILKNKDLDNAKTSLESKIADTKQSLATTEDTLTQKNIEKNELITEISNLKKQVAEWSNKSNLFTAELDGVLTEYNKQMFFCIFLSLVPLSIVAMFSTELYAGSLKLLDVITPDVPAQNTITYLITRLPFVSICLGVIYGLLNWVYKPLILKVFEIADFRSLLQARIMLVTKLTREISKLLELSRDEEASVLIDQKMKYIEETLSHHFKTKLNAAALSANMNESDMSVLSVAAKTINKLLPKL